MNSGVMGDSSEGLTGSKTLIKIVNIENGQVIVVLRGHFNLIHDLDWSQDDNFLVSASADGSTKVWDLRQKERDELPDKLNYTEND